MASNARLGQIEFELDQFDLVQQQDGAGGDHYDAPDHLFAPAISSVYSHVSLPLRYG
jgi:hypothetical protein